MVISLTFGVSHRILDLSRHHYADSLFISTTFHVPRSVISFLRPDLYFTYIRFQQNSDLVRSAPQVVKVWMPPAYTFRKLVHILWFAAAVILKRQFPCYAFRKCVYTMLRWWQQQLQPLLSDTDIAAEITESPILQKRAACFSHYIVICTVQTAGAVGVCVCACVCECVCCHRLDGLCYGRRSVSVCGTTVLMGCIMAGGVWVCVVPPSW